MSQNVKKRAAPGWRQRSSAWGRQHGSDFGRGLHRLRSRPLAALLMVGVVAVALSLPLALYVGFQQIAAASQSLVQGGQASVFLDAQVSLDEARAQARQIESMTQVATATVIPASEGLVAFREVAGFAEAAEVLDDNPLPHVVEAQLAPGLDQAETDQTITSLRQLPQVTLVRFDQSWQERLRALGRALGRAVVGVAALLGLGVVLIIGNTIRLDVAARVEEIEVVKLIGATDAFVRRPFLYVGLFYGLLGAGLAVAIVQGGLAALTPPLSDLAASYGVPIAMPWIGWPAALATVIAGALAGLSGSYLVVTRHLWRFG